MALKGQVSQKLANWFITIRGYPFKQIISWHNLANMRIVVNKRPPQFLAVLPVIFSPHTQGHAEKIYVWTEQILRCKSVCHLNPAGRKSGRILPGREQLKPWTISSQAKQGSCNTSFPSTLPICRGRDSKGWLLPWSMRRLIRRENRYMMHLWRPGSRYQ